MPLLVPWLPIRGVQLHPVPLGSAVTLFQYIGCSYIITPREFDAIKNETHNENNYFKKQAINTKYNGKKIKRPVS